MLLKDIFTFSNGKSWSNLDSGDNPIYGSTGIIGYSSETLFNGENTLIARVGANCGYLQYVNGNYWVTDNTIVATAKPLIIPKYGFYLLGTLGIQRLKIGAAQPLLTIGILNSIETNIHSLDEQLHIVNTIGSVDDLIENKQKQIDKICLFLEVSLQLYEEKRSISEYAPEIIKSGINKFDKTKNYLDTSCVEGINNISSSELIEYNKRPSRANMQPIANSVWFAKMKDSNKILIITDKDKDILSNNVLSTGFLGIKASSKLPLSLLASIVISNDFKIQRDLNSVGTTMAGVNNETFLKIQVPYLNENEALAYEDKYSSFVYQLSSLRREIDRLKLVKKALLKKYF